MTNQEYKNDTKQVERNQEQVVIDGTWREQSCYQKNPWKPREALADEFGVPRAATLSRLGVRRSLRNWEYGSHGRHRGEFGAPEIGSISSIGRPGRFGIIGRLQALGSYA